MSLYLAVELNDETKLKLTEKQVYLKQNCIKGDFEDPTRFHITVRYLNKETNDADLAIEGMKLFEQQFHPRKFEIIAQDFHKFEQGVMWIGINNSFPLYACKYKIQDSLIDSGFPLQKDTHKGYTPHITMGYDVEESSTLNTHFEGIPIIVDNLSLWNGFKANGEYIHNKLFGVNFK